MDVKPPKGSGVFDVNEPKNVKAEATSRPIIVGHKPVMPDPMVNQRPIEHHLEHPPQPPVEPAEPKPTQSITDIAKPKPLHPDYKPSLVPKPADSPAGPAGIIEGEPLQSPPFATPAKDTQPPPTHMPGARLGDGQSHQAPHPTVVPPDNIPIELPAGHPLRRKSGHPLGWLLAFIFLAAIGAYLAIDAGLIQTDIDLPVHIFNQEEPPVYSGFAL